MRYERITLPSSDGAQVALDLYVPSVYEEIDPQMRRPAIVICPGGGYRYLSCREAEPVALRFLSEGFNCFVVWPMSAPMLTSCIPTPTPLRSWAFLPAVMPREASAYRGIAASFGRKWG